MQKYIVDVNRRWWLSGCLLLALTGCESMRTVMTQHEVQLQVETHPRNSVGEYFLHPSPPAFPFDRPGYEDAYMKLYAHVYLWGFVFDIERKHSSIAVIRWDEAKFAVDDNALQPIRMKRSTVEERRILDSEKRAVVLTSPSTRITLIPDYSVYFDSPYAFGTQRVAQGQGFIYDGVGRSMVLELPIEYDGERVTYLFTFTATDVKQWNSYH